MSWTTQGFPPVVPFAGDATGENFQPFGVGLVQLDDVVRVEARLTENDPARLDFGMEVELRIVPSTSTPTASRSSPSPSSLSGADVNDVAIIGIGLHPFGRFGDKTPFQMAADADEDALADAGITWSDVQFAVGGSWEAAQLDLITGLLGLTGIPFTNVFNARDRGEHHRPGRGRHPARPLRHRRRRRRRQAPARILQG